MKPMGRVGGGGGYDGRISSERHAYQEAMWMLV